MFRSIVFLFIQWATGKDLQSSYVWLSFIIRLKINQNFVIEFLGTVLWVSFGDNCETDIFGKYTTGLLFLRLESLKYGNAIRRFSDGDAPGLSRNTLPNEPVA